MRLKQLQVFGDFYVVLERRGICHPERKCDVDQRKRGNVECRTPSRTQVPTISATACEDSMNYTFGAKENIWITQEQRQIPFKFHLIWLAQVNYSFFEREASWRIRQMLRSNYTSEVGLCTFCCCTVSTFEILWVWDVYFRLQDQSVFMHLTVI